jgi:hypothetical protein
MKTSIKLAMLAAVSLIAWPLFARMPRFENDEQPLCAARRIDTGNPVRHPRVWRCPEIENEALRASRTPELENEA